MHTMNASRLAGEMHATGRMREQEVWQWTGKQNARTEMQQAGVMEKQPSSDTTDW